MLRESTGLVTERRTTTDTCRAILSYKGVLYKKHLLGGVAKGAFTEAEAEARFNKWLEAKAGKIEAKTNKLAADAKSAEKARLAAEGGQARIGPLLRDDLFHEAGVMGST